MGTTKFKPRMASSWIREQSERIQPKSGGDDDEQIRSDGEGKGKGKRQWVKGGDFISTHLKPSSSSSDGELHGSSQSKLTDGNNSKEDEGAREKQKHLPNTHPDKLEKLIYSIWDIRGGSSPSGRR
ncbi:hypothetical protein C2845_PM12G28660 [Panicum miliaceum]|uniref:Uncharacterized protein n=1 Tax=Panicum miliaceum TaxID=4540 RepID=A0A3L6QJA5_PANMI|nr:hypothetical protein C2845_PM12G28660 [Panicum miliaceum]